MSTESWMRELNAALTEFVAVLSSEGVALGKPDAQAISDLAVRKEGIGLELARLWRGLSIELGLQDTVGLPTLRDFVTRGSVPTETFDSLEHLCLQADRQNRINGRLIEEQISRTQVAMNILQQAAVNHSLYGADGRMVGMLNRNRSIDSA